MQLGEYKPCERTLKGFIENKPKNPYIYPSKTI